MTDLVWQSYEIEIDKLKPYEFNPRRISKESLKKLKDSVTDIGYAAPILIDTDGTIVAGHMRWQALKLLGYKEVDVRAPNRKLTEKEFKEVNIRDNINNGDWDYEILANNFEHQDLIEWGLDIPDYSFDDDKSPYDEDKPKAKKLTQCPECGHEF